MAQNKTNLAHDALILFTRFPAAGKVKTRLQTHLGPQGAADLHKKMTEHTLNRIRPALQAQKIELQIFFCGGDRDEMAAWLGKHSPLYQQQGRNLGQRMGHAFECAFLQGAGRVLLIGSDCPGLTADIICHAMEALENHALVLGPAADGGYYLIGLRCREQERALFHIFNTVDWGTDQVLAQTAAQAQKHNLSFFFLPRLHDIDRPEDLVHFNHHTCS
jgi:rSAM/selenodomain-associated transferase 1